jgi:hypothetical protein
VSEAPRLLRARPRPARLIESGVGGADPSAVGLSFRAGEDQEPLVLWRLGATDLDAGLAAISEGAGPAAVVVGINERADVRNRARRATERLGAVWIPDPFLFKTSLPNYRTARHLQELDYTPGRDADPYRAEEFADARACRLLAGQVIGAQFDIGASGGVFAGAFAMRGPDDPWLAVNQELLTRSPAERDRWGQLPLIAPVIASIGGFSSPEAQATLVRTLTGSRPEAHLIMLDGLEVTSSAARQLAAIRLSLLFQEVSAPALLGRCGGLRYPFLAFGLAGIEVGLGRFLRFSLSDYTGKGGRGAIPPRFEFPSLLCALPSERAVAVLAAEVVPESECDCPACAGHAPAETRVERATVHDGFAIQRSVAAHSGVSPRERVEAFSRAIDDARWLWHDVERAGIELGRPVHLEQWKQLVDMADGARLLEPGRLADELGLG